MIKNTKKFLKCNNEIIRNMIKCLLDDNIPPPCLTLMCMANFYQEYLQHYN